MISELPEIALSVRTPWPWFIFNGGKDIENRDWRRSFTGRIWLHTSKWFKRDEVKDDAEYAIRLAGWREQRALWPTMDGLKAGCGCIVGSVEIVDCVSQSDSPWFFGKYGFVLQNPIPLQLPVPCKGALGFFKISDEIRHAIAQQWNTERRLMGNENWLTEVCAQVDRDYASLPVWKKQAIERGESEEPGEVSCIRKEQ
jgi:hypothetical protein